jgi:hypothetical protein
VPQPPQFIGSVVVSMHAPPQHDSPVLHRLPVLPQTHMPPEQTSPMAHAVPTSPQLFGSVERLTHWKVPALAITQTSLPVHDGKFPHEQLGPIAPVRVVHALARVMSQVRPQPLQLRNELLERPSAPGATWRSTHVVPQQRCDELHDGEHMPGGSPESSRPPSGSGPPTHAADMHRPDGHATPHIPQFCGSSLRRTQREPSPLGQQASKGPQPPQASPRSLPPAQETRREAARSVKRARSARDVIRAPVYTPNLNPGSSY